MKHINILLQEIMKLILLQEIIKPINILLQEIIKPINILLLS